MRLRIIRDHPSRPTDVNMCRLRSRRWVMKQTEADMAVGHGAESVAGIDASTDARGNLREVEGAGGTVRMKEVLQFYQLHLPSFS